MCERDTNMEETRRDTQKIHAEGHAKSTKPRGSERDRETQERDTQRDTQRAQNYIVMCERDTNMEGTLAETHQTTLLMHLSQT